MSTVRQREADALLDAIAPVVAIFLDAAARSVGDFHVVEEAGAAAILKLREQLMTSGLRVSSQCAERSFHCPACQAGLHVWEKRDRKIETCEGEATYTSVRYRCPKCAAFHAPLDAANGLSHSQFTTMAQGLIGTTAAQFAYAPSTAKLWERGVRVSAKEVDRTARDVAAWRRDEEKAVASATFGEAVSGADAVDQCVDAVPKLFDWSRWKHEPSVLISVDGGKVRSPDRGADGLEWFESRAAVIAPVDKNSRANKVYLGGVASADAIFDMVCAAWRQGPHKDCQVVFVADGAPWIWERVRLYFSGSIEVLDIYHAGEHVASAAAARWGEGSQEHRQWRSAARDKLLEPRGVQLILRALLADRRKRPPSDKEALKREVAYLWRHRRRMRYHWLRQQGLPIGSGVMESAIKQVATARLRAPGMKWTREGADAMIALRTAHLSNELHNTALRRHHTRLAELNRYKPRTLQCAA